MLLYLQPWQDPLGMEEPGAGGGIYLRQLSSRTAALEGPNRTLLLVLSAKIDNSTCNKQIIYQFMSQNKRLVNISSGKSRGTKYSEICRIFFK